MSVLAMTPRKPELKAIGGGVAPSSRRLTDEELTQGIVAGDERIAVELYRRLLPVVDRSICRVLGVRGPDHEDLIQLTFEQLIRTIVEQRFAHACSLSTWATSIGGRIALKAIRSRRRARNVFATDMALEGDEANAQSDVESATLSRAELRRVQRCLARLKPEKAEAVVLHDVLGCKLAEIAQMTSSSVAAAQSRLFRGRAELLKLLETPTSGPERKKGLLP